MPKVEPYCDTRFRTNVVDSSSLEERIPGYSVHIEMSWTMPLHLDREGVLFVLIKRVEELDLPIEILDTNLGFHKCNWHRELFFKGFIPAGHRYNSSDTVFSIKAKQSLLPSSGVRLVFAANEKNGEVADILRCILDTFEREK